MQAGSALHELGMGRLKGLSLLSDESTFPIAQAVAVAKGRMRLYPLAGWDEIDQRFAAVNPHVVLLTLAGPKFAGQILRFKPEILQRTVVVFEFEKSAASADETFLMFTDKKAWPVYEADEFNSPFQERFAHALLGAALGLVRAA